MAISKTIVNNYKNNQVKTINAPKTIASVPQVSEVAKTPTNKTITNTPTYSSVAPTFSSAPQAYSGAPRATGGPKLDANGKVDISNQIDEAIRGGKDYGYVQDLLNQRYDKINSSGGSLDKYKGDSISLAAEEYIRRGQAQAEKDRIQSEYDAIAARQQAALDAYLEQITGSLSGQKRGVEQDAENLAKEAYLAYRQNMRTAPQALSASGFSGGIADSQLAALQANLQNNQNQIQENKVNALYGIDQAITDAQLQASVEAARAKADMGMAALDAWNSYINQERQFDYGREQAATENARWEKEFGNSQLQNQYNRDKEAAVLMASVGNFSALSRLWGLSDEDTASLINDYAQQKQLSATQSARELADWKGQYGDFSGLKDLGVNVNLGALKSGSGGGGSSAKYNQTQFTLALQAYQNGDRSPQVVAAIEGYSGLPINTVLSGYGIGVPISSFNQLGDSAKSIAERLSRGYGNVAGKGQTIFEAREKGVITEEEAQYLLDMIGAPNNI